MLILHHYPESPVSEKVRVAFGLKGLSWHSVKIPRMPPKPDLMPLTGGYRRTPVMQIGADIYCDSFCILQELERRFPEPSFFPGGSGDLVWGLSRWSDGILFEHCIRLVLGSSIDEMPADFAADRARLYFGPDWDLEKVACELPHVETQIRAQFAWFDRRLANGAAYLAGAQPGLVDALAYYLVWFVRGRWQGGPDFLAQCPDLLAWEAKVAALGHGEVEEMSADEALAIAREATSTTARAVDAKDPQALTAGMTVQVTPDVDGGDPPVSGRVLLADIERIAILREDPQVGEICIHFPRVGYRVRPI